MDDFNQRISLDEASHIVRLALKCNQLNPATSAIFHHLGLMRARIASLQVAFPASCLHAVAIKANPVVGVLREIVALGAGLEAASIEEVALALAAGCPAERIVYDSPAKTIADIRHALERGVYLNVDNFDELARVAAAQTEIASRSVIGLRINTLVGGGSIAHTSVSGANSKFGVPLDREAERIIDAFSNYSWLNGLHVHVGSQGCRVELLVEAAARAAALRGEIAARTGRSVTHIDIGGGLPTNYRETDASPTPAEYRALLEEKSPDLFVDDVLLTTEFGRAIHANCGLAASRVEYVKPAQQLVVTHLGADFLLRPVYRPENWQHELFVLDRHGLPKLGSVHPTTVAGPLCFAGDVIARGVLLPPVEVGDWIVLRDVGAYTLSMWSRHCSRGIPSVWGFDPETDGELRLLRGAEAPDDIVRFWSEDFGTCTGG